MQKSCLIIAVLLSILLGVGFVSAAIADHIVISEFLVDSSGVESAYEFVEFYNGLQKET